MTLHEIFHLWKQLSTFPLSAQEQCNREEYSRCQSVTHKGRRDRYGEEERQARSHVMEDRKRGK